MQLSAEINFISLKPGSDETRVMYTRSDNDEFISGDDTNEIIKLLFVSFLQRFEENLQNKMKGSELEIKLFIDQYNWKDIDFPPTNKDWRKLELNNDIALNILYIPHNTKKIQLAYRSKSNLTCNKHIILLMITDGEKWHYLAVKINQDY